MSVIGGDISEISINNSQVGNRVLKVKANEGNTYDPGGLRANDDASQVTTAAEPIWQLNMKMGGLMVTCINDMVLKTDEYLVAVAGSLVDSVFTFTVVNGKSYRGTGRIVGDIVPNINDSTVSLTLRSADIKQI